MFKRGDKVRIIGIKDLYDDVKFAPGTIHTVLSCDEHYCRVNPDQPSNGYGLFKFELVKEFKTTKKDKGWGF